MIFVISTGGFAQWSIDPSKNTPICTADSDQIDPQIVTDGAGGAIVVWKDYRRARGDHYDLYGQRIAGSGFSRWQHNGVLVKLGIYWNSPFTIASDGRGGVLVVWDDAYRIYAQRIDANGVRRWASAGTMVGGDFSPSVVDDDSGGAIIAWHTESQILVQRIDSAGNIRWPSSGKVVSTKPNGTGFAKIMSDNAAGAIVAWQDYRNNLDDNIYAQRINANGERLWDYYGDSNGVPICTSHYDQKNISLVPDTSGGAIIAWIDDRNGLNRDVYAQKVRANGHVVWTLNGVMATSPNYKQVSQLTVAPDDVGGIILAWADEATNPYVAYTQRIDTRGVVKWDSHGLRVSTGGAPTIVNGRQGSAIVTVMGWPNGIYSAYIDSAGYLVWSTLVAGPGSNPLNTYPCSVSDGFAGAIIAWSDNRNSIYTDIIGQRIFSNGNLFDQPQITSISDVPNDQGSNVEITWNKIACDDTGTGTYKLTSYSVWRRKPSAVIKKNLLPHRFAEMDDTLHTLYDSLVSIPADQSQLYHAIAATLADSTAGGVPRFTYLVVGTTTDSSITFPSAPDSGYSVDNLAPMSATSLMAVFQIGPKVHLNWARDVIDPDVSDYEVHRSTQPDFTPWLGTLIGTIVDTTFTDTMPHSNASNNYRIITKDIHGNISMPSDPAQVLIGSQDTIRMDVQSRWNMISVSLSVNDYSLATLFPTSVSNAFYYDDKYRVQTTLRNTAGYWLKFGNNQEITISGYRISDAAVVVNQGWNLIGSISDSVEVSTIMTEPSSMTTSDFYGYEGRYNISNVIYPGKGYWVKVDQPGMLILTRLSPFMIKSASCIHIVPTNDLPPPPPDESSLTNNEMPRENVLEQAYPNPFNPTTTIKYQLPVNSKISLKVYNALGQGIATLANEVQQAGYKSVEWNAGSVASGVYFYRLEATSISDPGHTFTQVKKMILCK